MILAPRPTCWCSAGDASLPRNEGACPLFPFPELLPVTPGATEEEVSTIRREGQATDLLVKAPGLQSPGSSGLTGVDRVECQASWLGADEDATTRVGRVDRP